MKNIKNIFIFFLLVVTLSFSIETKKSTVYLEKENEVSKLKIGVTKLKSENLPLNFDVNSKKIYGEIDIDDNDVVYVSETLAEIPSVSTTNGRKAINNIKRYLTKEIKEAPNFEYQIVKDERDKQNIKKYLVIDCKRELKGVYVYIVEKNTYKVKKVYKGSFVQLLKTMKNNEEYGIINITANYFDKNSYSQISFNGSKPIISKKDNINEEDVEASKYITLTGNYPKKVTNGKRFDTLTKWAAYQIKVYKKNSNTEVGNSEVTLLDRTDFNILNSYIKINDGVSSNASELGIVTKPESDYYFIYIKQNYPYIKAEYKVVVEYGCSFHGGKYFEKKEEHSFELVIEPKVKPPLPENTKGTIILQNIKKQGTLYDTEVNFNENGAEVKSGNLLKYKGFIGEVPEILDLSNEENKKNFIAGNRNILKIEYSNNDEKTKTWTKEIDLKEMLTNGKISFDITGSNIYNKYNKQLGILNIKADSNKKYFDLIFKAVDSSGKVQEWPNTYREVTSTLTFRYMTIGNGEEKILKEDTLKLAILPVDEKIAPETRGTLLITLTNGLPGHDLFIKNGELSKSYNSVHKDWEYDLSNVFVTGELPTGFASNNNSNNYWVNTEDGYRLQITTNSGQIIETKEYNGNGKNPFLYTTGGFESKSPAELKTKNTKIGEIFFSYSGIKDGKDSITIGFGNKVGLIKHQDFSWGKNEHKLNETYKFEYQVNMGGEYKTIKTDILELVIQPGLDIKSPIIELKNPLVYYDYNSSSAISNIVHNRRVHLAKNETKTLNNNGSLFRKNTNLLGNEWIEAKNVTDYLDNTKHKVSITKGKNEVLKTTKDNGGTISSTYLSGDGNKNEVMFSYDGGNKYLNFGLSKYNFEGETIKDIVITHFGSDGNSLKERRVYSVIIPKFEGIHYMGNNFDIKPKQNYIKNYEYNHNSDYDKEVIIDYGTVGFRDLDTRITNQSSGEGIDFRVTKKVKLIHLDKNNKETGYIINNAELYFENGIDVSNDTSDGTSRFKGKNEKSTSAILKLKIPVQETLVKDGKYKILTNEQNKVKDVNPLRIGVTVNNNKEKYYTYMGGESFENGNIGNTFTTGTGKNLYLNITTKRFVETVIEFENENLKKEKGNINWIKLNKTNFFFGKLTNKITLANGKQSDIWGRVKGDIIDIPVNIENSQNKRNLKMSLFDDNNKVLIDNLNTVNGEYKFALTSTSNNNPRNFIISRENVNDNYIRFSLNNGYDATKEKDIKFYIRYIDTSNGQNKFLFDQRYIVKFKPTVNYKGDITIRFKNPSMAMDTNKNGAINLYTRNYRSNSSSNHNTIKDGINWVELQISDETINNLKIDSQNSSCELYDNLNKVLLNDLQMKEFIEYQNNEFIIGLPKTKNIFETLFGNYTGNKIEKTFDMRFKVSPTGVVDDGKDKTYRLNIIINKFDPKYYGKVFVGNGDDKNEKTYEEINNVGDGSIDLMKNNNVVGDCVYVDLNTSYRDYLRYEALPKTLLGKDLFINVKGQVDAIPVGSNYAKPVKGDIVLLDGTNYIDITNKNRIIEFTKDGNPTITHKNYPLKLKLSLAEYKKLKPYTKYEVFLNENQNVITIGTDTLNDNILFNKPLNFTTTGPGITIETTVLDFGKINLENETSPLIIKEGKTEKAVKVTISGNLDNNLGVTTQDLTVDTDTIFIKQRGANNEVITNGGELKVRDLKTEKVAKTPVKPIQGNAGVVEEYYNILGTLEVPKNLPEEKYGVYSGIVEVTYTFY